MQSGEKKRVKFAYFYVRILAPYLIGSGVILGFYLLWFMVIFQEEDGEPVPYGLTSTCWPPVCAQLTGFCPLLDRDEGNAPFLHGPSFSIGSSRVSASSVPKSRSGKRFKIECVANPDEANVLNYPRPLTRPQDMMCVMR